MDLEGDDDEAGLRPSQTTITPASQRVLAYIETTFDSILNEIQLRPPGKPTIVVRKITDVKPYYDEEDLMRLKWTIEDRVVTYSFPGVSNDDAWRFGKSTVNWDACVGRILCEIYAAIRANITVTKRDIYYQDPALFRHQSTVDRYVDEIAYTCQATRRDLNVLASPKGLVAGLQRDGLVESNTDIILDHFQGSQLRATEHIKWILVVEKEATFNTLVESRFQHNTEIGPGLILTGKGYPDLTTRRFLRAVVSHHNSTIPVLGLFDYDPDGIRILKCYRFGSKALAQEHGSNLPEVEWVGLKSGDMVLEDGDGHSVLSLTTRDRAAAVSMLESHEWHTQCGEVLPGLQECHIELRRMLVLNRKAEIQMLDGVGDGLPRWLVGKFEGMFIRPEVEFEGLL